MYECMTENGIEYRATAAEVYLTAEGRALLHKAQTDPSGAAAETIWRLLSGGGSEWPLRTDIARAIYVESGFVPFAGFPLQRSHR